MDTLIHDKVTNFFKTYPKRTYPKDQIVIFGGESPEKVFFILTGRISQYDISYRGDEIVTNIFKTPAFFPMSWAINGNQNKYFFKAEESTEVHVAPPEDVIAFLNKNPDVMFNLLSRLYRGVDGVLERVVHLMSGSAKSRVIYELIIETDRFGKKLKDERYELQVSEIQLGTHAGLARETISREIKHLKDSDLIEVIENNIIVKDLNALRDELSRIT